jgi:hypothetical protein
VPFRLLGFQTGRIDQSALVDALRHWIEDQSPSPPEPYQSEPPCSIRLLDAPAVPISTENGPAEDRGLEFPSADPVIDGSSIRHALR